MVGRLQFVHESTPFDRREDAISYITERLKRESLIGEPIVITYYNKGLVDDLQLIIGIGKGIKDGRNLGYHIIDTKQLDEKSSELFNDLKVELTSLINNTSTDLENELKLYIDNVSSLISERVEALDSLSHRHSNKTELDKITEGDKAKWDKATSDIDAFLVSSESGEKALDTLKEIQAYIDSDSGATKEILSKIDMAQKSADNAQEDVNALIDKVGYIPENKTVSDEIYGLKSSISEEKDRATKVENEIKDIIGDGFSKSVTITEKIANVENISNAAATKDEVNIALNLKADKSALTEEVNTITNLISNEQNRALNAEKQLSLEISNMKNDYVRDVDLSDAINSIDEKINSKVSTEDFDTTVTSLRIKDDETELLISDINGKIDSESERAKGAENALLENITTLSELVGIDSVQLQIENKINTLDVNLAESYKEGEFVSSVGQTNGLVVVKHSPYSAITSAITNEVKTLSDKVVANEENVNILRDDIYNISGSTNETIAILSEQVVLLKEKVEMLETSLKRILGISDFETDENTYAVTTVISGRGEEISVNRDKNSVTIDFNSDLLGDIIGE